MATAPRVKPVALGHIALSAQGVDAQHMGAHVDSQSLGRPAVCKDSPRVVSLASIPMRPGERPGNVIDVSSEACVLFASRSPLAVECVAGPHSSRASQITE